MNALFSRSVLSLAMILTGVGLIGASAARVPHAATELLGTWRGTSKCTDLTAVPGCHDEVVVYEFTSIPKTDSILCKADKVVEGRREWMGDLDFAYDRKDSCWKAEYGSPRATTEWRFTVQGTRLSGTARRLPGNQVFRKIEASRSPGRGGDSGATSAR